jgi:hypothetical protein
MKYYLTILILVLPNYLYSQTVSNDMDSTGNQIIDKFDYFYNQCNGNKADSIRLTTVVFVNYSHTNDVLVVQESLGSATKQRYFTLYSRYNGKTNNEDANWYIQAVDERGNEVTINYFSSSMIIIWQGNESDPEEKLRSCFYYLKD